MQRVDVVVGGQYGSEAKGHVVAQLLKSHMRMMPEGNQYETWNIRVAGPNAGHTAYDTEGNKFAYRTVPLGAIVDDRIKLYIAPGSEIDPPVLADEINKARECGHETKGRFWISREATIITNDHKAQEAALVGKVGSTGKGIGAARAERILRQALRMVDVYDDAALWNRFGMKYAEPEDLYATDEIVREREQMLVIEGTQGFGLSFRASGNYPQVTSNDCRTVDFLSMAGIDPTRCGVVIQPWVVARVYPIRVAGNSGPMRDETTWEELGLEPELTTVTQKVRRVGVWDFDLVRRAIQANGGHNAKLIVSMVDQIIPEFKEFARLYDGDNKRWDGEGHPHDHPAIAKAEKWFKENLKGVGTKLAGFTFSPTQIVWTAFAEELPEDNVISAQYLDEIVDKAVQSLLDSLGMTLSDEDEDGAK